VSLANDILEEHSAVLSGVADCLVRIRCARADSRPPRRRPPNPALRCSPCDPTPTATDGNNVGPHEQPRYKATRSTTDEKYAPYGEHHDD
jgi:hypothetical protein